MIPAALRSFIPRGVKRQLHVFFVDKGWPVVRKEGHEGISQLGYREYVGGHWEKMGILQYEFMLSRGLKPSDVLLDVACGSLRAGQYFIKHLDKGNYLGLEMEKRLVELGIEHEIGEEIFKEKSPQFVISSIFAFDEFTKSPDFATAISLFTHLTGKDIAMCLENLAFFVRGSCQFFVTFFETVEPTLNYRRSHAHLAFYYTKEQMEEFGRIAGWTPTYIGEWGHPVGQKIVQFSIDE